MTLPAEHVRRFNDGVRTGDFAAMLELFADDAELEFVGIPVGPFHGRAAIAEAYRVQPPDDEIVVLEERRGVAVYAWASEPSRPAGELQLEERGGLILRLRILYEQFS